IPNRTVKRLYADDSADSRVKVGNRQAPLKPKTPARQGGGFCIWALKKHAAERRHNPSLRTPDQTVYAPAAKPSPERNHAI
ncbi:hypothetical protein KDX20_34180, partial [Burkholderia cenocepacia]|uniref:hypothetical protein n=1 Tax=Burkholderia cenocepacia TaxID=95486 RepID=UPI001B8FAC80